MGTNGGRKRRRRWRDNDEIIDKIDNTGIMMFPFLFRVETIQKILYRFEGNAYDRLFVTVGRDSFRTKKRGNNEHRKGDGAVFLF